MLAGLLSGFELIIIATKAADPKFNYEVCAPDSSFERETRTRHQFPMFIERDRFCLRFLVLISCVLAMDARACYRGEVALNDVDLWLEDGLR